MNIQLSDHFTYSRLLRFVLPSVAMMLFTSIYGVVDGLFISNFVGTTPFAAVNVVIPYGLVLGSFGFMLGTGGSALVAKTLGEGKKELANQIFSLLVAAAVIFGVLLTIFGYFTLEKVSVLQGAEGEMLEDCLIYGNIILFALPGFLLQNIFQSLLIAAEKPHLGLAVTVLAGVTNMVLDALFIAVFHWGVAGAALATGISQSIGGIIPFVYFLRKNDSLLRLTKPKFMGRHLWKACTNGVSELVSNVSMSLVSMLYNLQLMKIVGENGVAAYGVVMYVNFIFVAVYLGYAFGTAPIISYHYGARNTAELQNVLKKSLKIIFGTGITLFLIAFTSAGVLSRIFVGYDAELCAMTTRGFRLYAFSFLLNGFNLFGSSFFTALNNGVVSAVVSFLRTVVFEVAAVMILPIFFALDGIWCAVTVAEIASLCITTTCFFAMRKRYNYL